MKITAEPRSDQWNADDFTGGPRTFTVAGVKKGAAEQKYDIELVEGEGRVWRPPATMLRALMAAWGDEAEVWYGRKVRLYQDPAVRFGPDTPGGIRISHFSHIDGPLVVLLTVSRGKRKKFTFQPLIEPVVPTQPARDWLAESDAAPDVDALRSLYMDASASGAEPETLDYIKKAAAS